MSSQSQQQTKSHLTGTVLSMIVCVAVDLVVLFFVVSAYQMTPAGAWDEDVLTAIDTSAFVGGVLAILSVLLRIPPVALPWLRWWWFLPPTLLLIAAIVRFAWISHAYPM